MKDNFVLIIFIVMLLATMTGQIILTGQKEKTAYINGYASGVQSVIDRRIIVK